MRRPSLTLHCIMALGTLLAFGILLIGVARVSAFAVLAY